VERNGLIVRETQELSKAMREGRGGWEKGVEGM
jgi:hypothetical protein